MVSKVSPLICVTEKGNLQFFKDIFFQNTDGKTVGSSASTETICNVRWGKESTLVIDFNSKYLTFLFPKGFVPFLHISVLLFYDLVMFHLLLFFKIFYFHV